MVPSEVLFALNQVEPLKKGKTAAPERQKVKPVAPAVVESTLSKLPALVADMVRFQWLTGCRSGEVRRIRFCEIDQSQIGCLVYRPAHHKTEHHDLEREIYIGPQAQAVLLPRLPGLLPNDYVFSPQRSEAQRKEQLRANRKSKVQPSQIDRRKLHPRRTPREYYDPVAYAQTIARAAGRAKMPKWCPNQ